MALYEQGIKNILVLFGTSVNTNIINYLSSKPIKRIIFAVNNDKNSPINRGLVGGIKNYLKLSKYFDLDVLYLRTPPDGHNDFGDAHVGGCDLQKWASEEINVEKARLYIFNYITENGKFFNKQDLTTSKRLRNV